MGNVDGVVEDTHECRVDRRDSGLGRGRQGGIVYWHQAFRSRVYEGLQSRKIIQRYGPFMIHKPREQDPHLLVQVWIDSVETLSINRFERLRETL